MLAYAVVRDRVIVPLAAIFFRAPPEAVDGAAPAPARSHKASVLGLRPNTMFALMAGAAFLCCVPMAMPQGHSWPSAATSASRRRMAPPCCRSCSAPPS